MSRFYYANSVPNFLLDSPESILGTLTQNSQFDVTDLQRNTWIQEIQLLTRARQGMVVFVPKGNPEDETSKPEWYDQIYARLKGILNEV